MDLPYLNPEEVKQFLNTITNVEHKTAIMLGFDLGCRVGEINKIPNSNTTNMINVLDSKAESEVKKHKNRNPYRDCIISNATLNQVKTFQAFLKATKDHRRFLFPYNEKTFNRWIKHWCEQAGIKREKSRLIRWHMLRHTYIQNAINKNVKLKQVSQQTGDSIFTLLRYYNNYSPEQRLNEVERTSVVK